MKIELDIPSIFQWLCLINKIKVMVKWPSLFSSQTYKMWKKYIYIRLTWDWHSATVVVTMKMVLNYIFRITFNMG